MEAFIVYGKEVTALFQSSVGAFVFLLWCIVGNIFHFIRCAVNTVVIKGFVPVLKVLIAHACNGIKFKLLVPVFIYCVLADLRLPVLSFSAASLSEPSFVLRL